MFEYIILSHFTMYYAHKCCFILNYITKEIIRDFRDKKLETFL